MKTMDFYLIHAISNLHVGSGEGDFSVIDKQVQRDQTTRLPIIHASGIKGAIREAMEYEQKNGATATQVSNNGKNPIVEAFGSDPKDRKSIQQGKYNFYDARLLALPARSSHDFFYVATCPALLEEAIKNFEMFQPQSEYLPLLKGLAEQASENAQYFGTDQGEPIRLEEEWDATYNEFDLDKLTDLFGDRLALLSNHAFDRLANELPIIARNYLNDGISENLWYEEVVSREARFITMIAREDGMDYLNTFLGSKNNLVQLGANATVGYGLCSFKKLN